jgi:glycosyltransferase involved in cell wall biosynthesis
MRVGIVAGPRDPSRGGAERYLRALEERFRGRGHEILPPERAERTLATLPAPGCDFYQPHHGVYAASIPPHYEAMPWGVRHVRRWNPVRRAHFARLRALEARTVASATVLALSPRVVADLARHHPSARALLLRPGVDLGRFRPGGRGGHLLFVATNFRLKGLPTAIRALDHLPSMRLVVAGQGRPIPHPRVEYRGFVEDLPALYRDAAVLVHPTFYDTAASVVLEALASGVPPVTTVRDGNADLAIEGGGGAVEDPRDARALARAVEEALARRSPERARAVAARFPEEAMLDRVVEAVCGS